MSPNHYDGHQTRTYPKKKNEKEENKKKYLNTKHLGILPKS